MSAAFDEMNGTDGLTRPAYRELAGWLGQVPPDILQQRRREAGGQTGSFGILLVEGFGKVGIDPQLFAFEPEKYIRVGTSVKPFSWRIRSRSFRNISLS